MDQSRVSRLIELQSWCADQNSKMTQLHVALRKNKEIRQAHERQLRLLNQQIWANKTVDSEDVQDNESQDLMDTYLEDQVQRENEKMEGSINEVRWIVKPRKLRSGKIIS